MSVFTLVAHMVWEIIEPGIAWRRELPVGKDWDVIRATVRWTPRRNAWLLRLFRQSPFHDDRRMFRIRGRTITEAEVRERMAQTEAFIAENDAERRIECLLAIADDELFKVHAEQTAAQKLDTPADRERRRRTRRRGYFKLNG